MTKRRDRAGFSLVELAIVLLIIGLIVGGVLKGQDLIRSARVNNVATTLNEVRAATNTFQDKYVAFPGDFSRPEMIDPGVFSSTEAGDGNGRIDDNNGESGGTAGQWWHDNESGFFWAHLAGAGLISGVDPEAIAQEGNLGDQSNPTLGLESAVGGYFTVGFVDPDSSPKFNLGGGTRSLSGHWFRLASDAHPGENTTAGVFSPVDLRSLDRKMDDGKSVTGDVIGNGNSGSCRDGDVYAAGESDSACVGWFRM